MKKSDFYFDLPERLIAQHPLEQRDASRLMVLDRRDGSVTHRHFRDLLEYVQPGDCMVFNNSRVIPARLMGHAVGHVTPIEVLLLTDKGDGKYTFPMPGSQVTVTARFKQTDTGTENPFTDISKNDYFYDAVLWAVEEGITSGTSDTTFSPNVSCTRAQMVTFLWRVSGFPKASITNPFTDVSADAYYYDAVLWAVEQGITGGTGGGKFSPDTPCTRAQMATFLWRANGSTEVTGTTPFSDVSAETYYYNAVLWAYEQNITNGTGGGKFSPDATCTRAQMVQMLKNASDAA